MIDARTPHSCFNGYVPRQNRQASKQVSILSLLAQVLTYTHFVIRWSMVARLEALIRPINTIYRINQTFFVIHTIVLSYHVLVSSGVSHACMHVLQVYLICSRTHVCRHLNRLIPTAISRLRHQHTHHPGVHHLPYLSRHPSPLSFT